LVEDVWIREDGTGIYSLSILFSKKKKLIILRFELHIHINSKMDIKHAT